MISDGMIKNMKFHSMLRLLAASSRPMKQKQPTTQPVVEPSRRVGFKNHTAVLCEKASEKPQTRCERC